DWFRREMELPLPNPPVANTGVMGMTWFHFWIMLSSAALIASFFWLYILKMRRASQLLSSLAVPTQQSSPLPPPTRLPRSAETSAPGRHWSGQLRVNRIFQETGDVKTFRLVNPVGGMLPFD